jgi:hypothetical protein
MTVVAADSPPFSSNVNRRIGPPHSFVLDPGSKIAYSCRRRRMTAFTIPAPSSTTESMLERYLVIISNAETAASWHACHGVGCIPKCGSWVTRASRVMCHIQCAPVAEAVPLGKLFDAWIELLSGLSKLPANLALEAISAITLACV